MSERLVEPQVGDVLGAIRRMTSDVPAPARAPLGPLVLTPAQRVHAPHELRRGGSTEPPPPLAVSGTVHDRLAPIDEEVLQELVRELLTEELQGPFGEKITRNIRKMVRAELGRAMAERDFK